jgi:hypothetical protein
LWLEACRERSKVKAMLKGGRKKVRGIDAKESFLSELLPESQT